jgi:hypothetical protein
VQPGYPQQGYQYPAPGQMPTAPQFPPSYAPNPNVPTAPPAPQNVAELGFSDPSGGVANPTARHLDGRTIVIVPKRVDEQAKYQGQDRPTAYFDLYVVDGGPIMYGDSEDRANPRPFTHTIETPAYFADAMSGNVLFVNEVKSKIGPNGQPTGMALGVVQRGTRGNKPWLLTRCEKDVDGNERPGGEARRQAAMQLVFAHRSGEWQPPRATPLAQAQTPSVPQVAYSLSVPPSQYGAQLPPTPNPYATPPTQPYAPVPQGVNVNAPVSAVPAPPTGYPPAPGWENNPAWGQFTPDQQSAIWQQFQQAQSNQPQSAPSASNGAAPAAGQAFPPGAAGTAPTGPGW